MAIQYVGGQTQSITASTATNTTINFSLTGGLASTPAADDIVIVGYGTGSTVNATIGVNTAGYTEVAELYISDTYDANLSVSWKRMGSTPDTSVQVGPTGATADGGFVTIQVFRGVNTTTALDVTSTTATAANSGIPNPAAIVPANANTDIIVIGATASTGGVTFTASYLSNFLTGSNTASTNDITMGAGWVSGPAAGVSYDPAAFSVTGSANTQSWATVTMALREQPTFVDGAALISPAGSITAAGELVVQGAATAAPDATATAVGERLAQGAAVASVAAATTAAADVVLAPTTGYGWSLYGVRSYGIDFTYQNGAATISPAATTTAAGLVVVQGAATATPAATTTVAGQRISLGAAQVSPAATVAAAAQRVVFGAALASPAATAAAAGQRLAIGAALVTPALTITADAQVTPAGVVLGSATIEVSATAVANAQPNFRNGVASALAQLLTTATGRLFWDDAAPQAEVWTPQGAQAEVWAVQAVTTETWTPQAANSESWTPATAGSKTWTQAV